MPPGLSSRFASARARDHAHDLVLQRPAGTRTVLVPDHQVDGQPLEPPVGVRLHQLPHQVDLRRRRAMRTQHDRQVAGDAVAPQARLPAAVARDHAAAARAAAGWRRGRCWPAGRRAACRPRSRRAAAARTWLCVQASSNTRSARVAVAVLLDQRQRAVAGLGDAGDEVDARRLVGLRSRRVLRIATIGSSTEPSLSPSAGAVHRRRVGDASGRGR